MSDQVRAVLTADTGRDIAELLNAACRNPVALLGLVIAESGLRERAARLGTWPDVSFGPCQQTVKFYGHEVPGVTLGGDGTALNTVANWDACRAWFSDAARAIPSAGRVFDRYLATAATVAQGADVALLACLWWNAPNLGGTDRARSAAYWLSDNLPRLDPEHAANRENYRRGLAAAEQYRAQEDPVAIALVMPVREEFAATPEGLAEYQKSLLEFAVAADLAGDADAGVAALKTLNPDRYKDLTAGKA